jgi:acetylornithine deacetylase/succinyl-diaminopimelate desuccinylase-like protein
MPVRLLKEIEAEVTSILGDLIRFDTTNPPGNETAAAQYLSDRLTNEGFQCEIIESAPNRGSLITRLSGSGEKPRLLLLSHLDVVAANAKEWTVPPFSGEVKDGFVWGRGALDMKGMTAIEVMTLILLRRHGVKLRGDVVLAATADEEMGGEGGAEYLLQHHREKIYAPYVLNEGGGSSIPVHNKNVYTVNTAEKGLFWFRVKARGVPGHGSMPYAADNAIMRMNKVVDCLGNYKGKILLVPSVTEFLNVFAEEDSNLAEPLKQIIAQPACADEVLDGLEKTAMSVVDEVRPRIRITITPTVIHGGVKENVIPSECEAVFDCRVLPGQSVAEARQLIRELLVDVGLEKLTFEDIQVQEPSESSMDTPLYQVIWSVLRDFEPGCAVAPVLMPGGTDSRFFRRLGSVCYGFHPLRSESRYGVKTTRREHGIDERISVENLVFSTSVMYETVKRFLT